MLDECYPLFGETYCFSFSRCAEDRSIRLLRNAANYLPHYTVLLPRKCQYSHLTAVKTLVSRQFKVSAAFMRALEKFFKYLAATSKI